MEKELVKTHGCNWKEAKYALDKAKTKLGIPGTNQGEKTTTLVAEGKIITTVRSENKAIVEVTKIEKLDVSAAGKGLHIYDKQRSQFAS